MGKNFTATGKQYAKLVTSIYPRLKPQGALRGIDWTVAAMRDIYKALAATRTKQFSIEATLTTTEWENIWKKWAKLELRNDYKIGLHVVSCQPLQHQKIPKSFW